MPPLPANVAADYDQSIAVARRAKNWLVLLLMLMLLLQMAAFFVARYTPARYGLPAEATPVAVTAATQPVEPAATQPTTQATTGATGRPPAWLAPVVRYVMAGIDFLGIVCVLLLAVVLGLITQIMLARNEAGLGSVTSAFVWCALLALLLFPWQSFLQDSNFTGEFKVPGVLYTYGELKDTYSGASFASTGFDAQTILHWARFVGWPAFSLILLLVVQAKSSRGVRAALGDAEMQSPDGYTMS